MNPTVLLIVAGVAVLLIALALRPKADNKAGSLDNSSENNGNTVGEDPSAFDTNVDESSNEELIAVITAAVLAASKSHPGIKLKVRSFRRIPQTSPVWNLAGRHEQISGIL